MQYFILLVGYNE